MSSFWKRDHKNKDEKEKSIKEKFNEEAIESLLREEIFSQEERSSLKEASSQEGRASFQEGTSVPPQEGASVKENILSESGKIVEMQEEAGAKVDYSGKDEVKDEVKEDSAEGENGLAAIEHLLDKRVLRAIKEMGFEKLSPIQEQAIPYLMQGDDIIGQAQTGTGKTAAFGIPAIQKVDPELRKLQTIILCPTRELAIQAAEELRKLAKYMHGIKILPVYGGQEIGKQIMGLKGVQIIVGTPGRVMDHMRRRTIKLDHVNMVVLDEADEMLNMGFREDMELILGQIPNEHQTALFSATMPKPILDITDQFQKDAKLIKIAAKELTIPLVSQKYYRIKSKDKDAACIRLLEYYQPKLTLIFCNTKKKVDELAEVLKQHGYQAEGLHGDMSQHQRDVAMNRFRNGSTNILIATDVAARGIDVDDVEAVINYDIPQDIEYYVHRIGRTGRAGRKGRSFTFVSGREIFQLREIERICHTTVEEKKLPGAAKVLKAKADKYLNQAWELHEHEDMELMKRFLARKMEEEGCDALELAAAMLKMQVGDRGQEIEADDFAPRRFGRNRGDGWSRNESRSRGDGRSRRGSRDREDRREDTRSRDESQSRRRSDGRKREESRGRMDARDGSGRSNSSGRNDGRRENGSRRGSGNRGKKTDWDKYINPDRGENSGKRRSSRKSVNDSKKGYFITPDQE